MYSSHAGNSDTNPKPNFPFISDIFLSCFAFLMGLSCTIHQVKHSSIRFSPLIYLLHKPAPAHSNLKKLSNSFLPTLFLITDLSDQNQIKANIPAS